MSDRNFLKTPDDIKRIHEAGRIIAEIFSALGRIDFAGLSTLEFDSLIDKIIQKAGARPSFKTLNRYDFASCISLNNEAAHGIPDKKRIIRKGDLVKVDIGVAKKGYFADGCRTFAVRPVAEICDALMSAGEESLDIGIGELVPENHFGDIGAAIQEYAEAKGFSIVRDFAGHGVGFAVHELPRILHYGQKGKGSLIQEGMVLAVEPIVNQGSPEVIIKENGWTAVTADGKLSVQYEHTVAVTKDGPLILTQ